MIYVTKMTRVNLWYELQIFGNPFYRDPKAESGLSGFRMFQDVSRCFGVGNLGHWEMIRATQMTPVNLWYNLQILGNPFHREPEAESMGHYEITRTTKMTPVNLWYKLQMLGNPFHRESEAESGLVSGCFEIFRSGKSGSLWNNIRHQNDPGEPVIEATNIWKPIS
jgi:hypothetical protein